MTTTTFDSKASTVYVNVYSLTTANKYWQLIGLGIYHSGIQIYGYEFFFGGNAFDRPGVAVIPPYTFGNAPERRSAVFMTSIEIGETAFSPKEVRDLAIQLGEETYRTANYDTFDRNCSHFSADFAKILTGKNIPGWINRMARVCGVIPCIVMMVRSPSAYPASTTNVTTEETCSSKTNKTLSTTTKKTGDLSVASGFKCTSQKKKQDEDEEVTDASSSSDDH